MRLGLKRAWISARFNKGTGGEEGTNVTASFIFLSYEFLGSCHVPHNDACFVPSAQKAFERRNNHSWTTDAPTARVAIASWRTMGIQVSPYPSVRLAETSATFSFHCTHPLYRFSTVICPRTSNAPREGVAGTWCINYYWLSEQSW